MIVSSDAQHYLLDTYCPHRCCIRSDVALDLIHLSRSKLEACIQIRWAAWQSYTDVVSAASFTSGLYIKGVQAWRQTSSVALHILIET